MSKEKEYQLSYDAEDIDALLGKVNELEQRIDNFLYEDIAIKSFTAKGKTEKDAAYRSTFEIGSNVTDVVFAWSFNRTPVRVTLDGEMESVSSTGVTLNDMNITGNKSWTLEATGEKGEKSRKSAGLTFLHGVYYGALPVGATIDRDAIIGMVNGSDGIRLQGNITGTFKMTATANQKLTFAAPSQYGEPTKFTSGGLDYTWDKVATFELENQSGHKEEYNVWQNSEVVVGTFNVTVVQE